jgi:hypothetical protein
MTTELPDSHPATPAPVPLARKSNEGLGPLVPCPFCGASKGYTLRDGDTYRWWLVMCAGCGAGVAECRSDSSTKLDAPKPVRWQAADDEWNEAGKHAQQLRTALQEADTIMGHDDEHTAWRERWQHLWPWGGPNVRNERGPTA